MVVQGIISMLEYRYVGADVYVSIVQNQGWSVWVIRIDGFFLLGVHFSRTGPG
jgi:hypothetical protein